MIHKTETQKLKCLLADEIKLNEDLIALVYECLAEIFDDNDLSYAQCEFRDTMEFYSTNGVLMAFEDIKREVKKTKANVLKWELKRKNEKKGNGEDDE